MFYHSPFYPTGFQTPIASFVYSYFCEVTIIENHIIDINNLCLAYKVRRLYAFGSVLTSRFNNDSDIDLIVDFEPVSPTHYADHYYNFKFSLEAILQKPVDLLEENAIRNPHFRKVVDEQRQVIYGH